MIVPQAKIIIIAHLDDVDFFWLIKKCNICVSK